MNEEIKKLGEPSPGEYETLNRQILEERLGLFIKDLLEHDVSRLVHLIYRHDVNEASFNRALGEQGIKKQAQAIAGLVIDRELQKIETRKRYKSSNRKNLPK